jgi:WD40 repeat protein
MTAISKDILSLILALLLLTACGSATMPTEDLDTISPTTQSQPTDLPVQTPIMNLKDLLSSIPIITPDNAHEIVLLQELLGHESVTDVAINPDGNLLASSGLDGSVRLWSLATGNEIISWTLFPEAWGITFSPDGRFLVSGGWGGTISIWGIK